MNKNQVSGRTDQAAGKVKEVAGKIVGNDRLQAEGVVQKNMGKVEAAAGDARENAKDAAKKAVDKM